MSDIRNALNRIREQRNSIIILSTHLISEVKELCDRVIIMDEGSIVYDSETDSVEKSLRVRFYEVPADGLNSIANEPVIEDGGKTAIFRVRKEVPNYMIIGDLMSRGAKIRDVEEASGIEEKYLKIVGRGKD
jgi:ABC-2 type transport system ATP-binding protein